MHPTNTGSASFTLHLTAAVALASLASPILATHLGISESRAMRRLTTSPGPIASGLDPMAARRLFTLLTALGLNLRLCADNDPTLRCDLSVQLSVWANLTAVSEGVAPVLARDPADIHQALTRPGGLVLADLAMPQARAIRARLAPVRGLVLIQANRDAALYDLFASGPLTQSQKVHLSALLRRVGVGPDTLTGACATGLAPPLRDHFLTRLPDLGLFALDRRFQRFDLYLTCVSGWVTHDLADFLAFRTGQPRARFEVISPDEPVMLDHGLTPAVLRQFCADYAAIGLSTRPLLRGLSRFPENPIL